MGTARRQYTDEFKREAVGLLASSDRTLSRIAEELGVAPCETARNFIPGWAIEKLAVARFSICPALCPIPGQNLTKMFHVKHFCPVGAKNLTNPHTSCGPEACGIARKFGLLGDALARLRAAAAFGL